MNGIAINVNGLDEQQNSNHHSRFVCYFNGISVYEYISFYLFACLLFVRSDLFIFCFLYAHTIHSHERINLLLISLTYGKKWLHWFIMACACVYVCVRWILISQKRSINERLGKFKKKINKCIKRTFDIKAREYQSADNGLRLEKKTHTQYMRMKFVQRHKQRQNNDVNAIYILCCSCTFFCPFYFTISSNEQFYFDNEI